MTDFAKMVEAFRKKAIEDVDKSIVTSTKSMFLKVIDYSPVADERYQQTRGTFVHSWNVGINTVNNSKATNPSPDKSGAIQKVSNAVILGIFLKGDSYITFSNSASHARRVEYQGWPASEGWSGTSGFGGDGSPYRPLGRAVQAFKLLV